MIIKRPGPGTEAQFSASAQLVATPSPSRHRVEYERERAREKAYKRRMCVTSCPTALCHVMSHGSTIEPKGGA